MELIVLVSSRLLISNLFVLVVQEGGIGQEAMQDGGSLMKLNQVQLTLL